MSSSGIISYYMKKESLWGYKLFLGGVRHTGYYPEGIKINHRQALINKMDLVAKKLDLPKGSKVLDAGCGEGATAIHLARKYGLQVEGIDLIPLSIEIAKKNATKGDITRVNFQTGDFHKLPFPDSSFDGVYTVETATHSSDILLLIEEFMRVLKPGGKLAIFDYETTPLEDMAKHGKAASEALKAVAEGWVAPCLLKLHHGDYEKLFQKSGLRDVKVEDITRESLPMFHWLGRCAYVPYLFVALGHKKREYPNITIGKWWLKLARRGWWNIIIASGTKPR